MSKVNVPAEPPRYPFVALGRYPYPPTPGVVMPLVPILSWNTYPSIQVDDDDDRHELSKSVPPPPSPNPSLPHRYFLTLLLYAAQGRRTARRGIGGGAGTWKLNVKMVIAADDSL